MAKVMISLPDELLARVDAYAAERGSNRSATLREMAESALDERQRELVKRMTALEGQARGRGGRVADVLRTSRPR